MPANTSQGDSSRTAIASEVIGHFSGKEAGPLRKALLAVALVGASFAGGAAVNGPGLRWALSLVGGVPDEDGSIPILDDELKKTRLDDSDLSVQSDSTDPKLTTRDVKDADAELEPDSKPKPDAVSLSEPEPKDPLPITKAQVRSPVPEPIDVPAPPPPLTSRPEPDPATVADPSDPERPVPTDLSSTEPAPFSLPNSEPDGATTAQPGEPSRLDPAVSPAVHQPEPPEPLASPDAGNGPSWTDLGRRMADMGVSRYLIEGEPGGPARFRCTVPLPGQRAVAQQFEAEGDSALAAAESALKRVALWKATEAP
jgi:hypothetical protein